jgi:oligopeptide transport system substrate-binding protein
MKKLTALLLALAMVLSLAACGSGSSSSSDSSSTDASTDASTSTEGSTEGTEGGDAAVDGINLDTRDGAVQDLVTYETAAREVETLNVLNSQMATDLQVITNLQDGLLTNDTHGNLVPCLAETWGTEDNGLTWTFNLRQDACWVDVNGEKMADLTSADFVTGLEWVLNSAKNGGSNTSMPIDMIEGAGDYYEYTKGLDEEEAKALAPDNETFLEMVGIETPDDYTVVYHCTAELPYFDTVATYACLYPAPAALIEELGVDGFYGETNENMWYSGPYVMTEYIAQNEKILEPNPLWWGNSENTRFNSITVKMVDSADVAYQLYEAGDTHNISLTESALSIIYNDPSNQFYDYLAEMLPTKYSYQIHFAYNKNNEDGTPDVNWNTAIANEAFRLSWYYGLDMSVWYRRTNGINPLSCENNCYTMSGLVYTSDGTDYTDLVLANLGLGEYNGETMVRYDADKAESYKQQAIEELTAQGVTFPVSVDYYISASSQTALDSANVLAQVFSDCLGDDYVTLNIKTYVSSQTQEVRTPHLASIYINGWGADYGDPENYLGQEVYGDDNAWYSVAYSTINDFNAEYCEGQGQEVATAYNDDLIATYEEYTALVKVANDIVDDMDARYEAFAEAEAYLIQHALVIPLYRDIEWELTCVNDYSKINAPYGIQNNRYLNWETNEAGYTTEDYEAFAAAYNAE